jgi:hypothetical protein
MLVAAEVAIVGYRSMRPMPGAVGIGTTAAVTLVSLGGHRP